METLHRYHESFLNETIPFIGIREFDYRFLFEKNLNI